MFIYDNIVCQIACHIKLHVSRDCFDQIQCLLSNLKAKHKIFQSVQQLFNSVHLIKFYIRIELIYDVID